MTDEELFGDRLPKPGQLDDIRRRAADLAAEMDRIDGPGLAVYHLAAYNLDGTLRLGVFKREQP